MMIITQADADCDRCGQHTRDDASPYSRLYPFKLAETITYRRRVIRFPWLCVKCMMTEKNKWWKARRAEGKPQ